MSCLLLTLLLLPLVGSGLVFAWKNNSSKYLALGIALVQMLLTFYILSDFDFTPTVDSVLQHEINYPWSQFMKSSLHFGIDGMSMLLLLLTNILAPIIILSSFNESVNYRNTFYGLILLMQFGLVGVFTSLDGLLFYIFWEVTLIPIWFIAGLWGQENKRFEFTTKFFVYTFVGSLFMLAGLIYVYNHSASFALTDLYNAQLNETQQTVVFWFIFFAFAVKLPVFPFHTWQPDTYTYSPTQGSMLLSGIMLKMAVYGVMRYLLPITPLPIAGISGQIVIILAIVGIVHGALIAIIQTDMKRIIAYSSFSHVGLMVAGIFASAVVTLRGSFNVEGAEGALVQTFAHGINVVGLFYCCDILYKRFKSRDIRQMGGLAKVAPKFAVLFLIIILGSMGVPLTNGFIGEFILLKSVYDFNGTAAVIAGLTVILCAVYLLRFYGKAMFGEGDAAVLSTAKDLSGVEFSVLASLAVFVILLGIFPQPVIDMVGSSVKFIYTAMAN
ncbi:NADH-quinone oxidoreductase subunit M [Chryseobacterium indologenes]|uniref:NADH-quinone oxidoreductase subunit M n=1 Tax=Chryseobacterium indologenes TaxID=253 RepID=A0AAD0YY73_CHRID|nr:MULTISPECIES: NADH-quinone oxidoreductase subunit M [Chryseobacterium]ASE63926.1 NADH-quinone oxidoreductase subunit M [Chryseobacterium indologenes]ATN03988.1 NADH-quinone oxidoreductase subunit M [Chryseobacterium indologenes]AYY83347.1 NADH-quinone oxidoreductase subunit M [Chryseobacterium indologenes]AYZ37157.1 NADH-quinone oxidoreductase subunit M [Chryseobacterium indologenes]AZB19703.1 NADH-quinone oxidoreductase subunit M [Chryseobacterium indologenes]